MFADMALFRVTVCAKLIHVNRYKVGERSASVQSSTARPGSRADDEWWCISRMAQDRRRASRYRAPDVAPHSHLWSAQVDGPAGARQVWWAQRHGEGQGGGGGVKPFPNADSN